MAHLVLWKHSRGVRDGGMGKVRRCRRMTGGRRLRLRRVADAARVVGHLIQCRHAAVPATAHAAVPATAHAAACQADDLVLASLHPRPVTTSVTNDNAPCVTARIQTLLNGANQASKYRVQTTAGTL